MTWILAKTPPEKKGSYCVLVAGETFKDCSSVGYWDGGEWEMMHEASGYQSLDPYFIDYDQQVTHWQELPKA